MRLSTYPERSRPFTQRAGGFTRDRAGTSAVEFAMLAPLFLLLLTGMAAYGIYLGACHSIEQIAADAARSALAGIDTGERKALVTSYIGKNAAGYAFIDPARLTVDAKDSSSDPNQFVVSLHYDARVLPIWALLNDLPVPGIIIERQSTIRVGGI